MIPIKRQLFYVFDKLEEISFGHITVINNKSNCLLIGIILRWGFLIWELIFYLGIGMLSLVTVYPVITAFHSCCLSHQDL